MMKLCLIVSIVFLVVPLVDSLVAQDAQKVAPLDPQSQAFIAKSASQDNPGLAAIKIQDARKGFNGLQELFGTGPSDVSSTDQKLDGRIPVRVYKPSTANDSDLLPVVLFFHGGGWVLGNLETHDALCRKLCDKSGFAVISVDYRLAPEHPFPAALDDCYDAAVFVSEHGQAMGVDGSKIVVAGDSAGGNLAAAVAIKARNTSQPKILAQVLIYPVLDDRCESRSYESFAKGFGLTRDDMRWFWKQYAGDQPTGVYASPVKAESLAGLPKTILLTAQYDVLHDEGEAFAEKLRQDGVEVESRCYDGMLHGFIHFATAFDKSQEAIDDLAAKIKDSVRHEK
jgi:acetyl esterase